MRKTKVHWSEDIEFVAELDREFLLWREGKEKGFTLAEAEEEINLLRQKREKAKAKKIELPT